MEIPIRTIRSTKVKVHTDNLGELEFEINPDGDKDIVSDETLLTVVVQHEIDHLDGILINDEKRRYSTTYVAPKTYGRNEMVMVKLPNGETEFMKYKNAQKVVGAEIL